MESKRKNKSEKLKSIVHEYTHSAPRPKGKGYPTLIQIWSPLHSDPTFSNNKLN